VVGGEWWVVPVRGRETCHNGGVGRPATTGCVGSDGVMAVMAVMAAFGTVSHAPRPRRPLPPFADGPMGR
jgi:hypothetical protein